MARGSRIPCERTRTLVSALLDGAGGEFERRLVEAHVRSCPECHAFQVEAQAFTDLLRSAPLESIVCQVQVPRRALRHARTRKLLSTAATFAGIAFVGSLVHGVAPAQDPAEVAVIGSPLVQPLMGEESIRSLAREGLVQGVTTPPPADGSTAAKPALPVVN